MINKDLIDLAYEVTEEIFLTNPSIQNTNLKSIVDGLKKKFNIDSKMIDDNIGSFYVELLQDNRFVFLGNDQWTLKYKITNEFYKRNQNSLYNFSTDSQVLEESYDEEALPEEMINADNEIYEEEVNEISRDSFSDGEMLDEFDDEDISGVEEDEIVDEKE